MDQGHAMQRRGTQVLNIRWKSAIRRVCVLSMSVASVYAAEPAQTTPGPDKSADALAEIVITGSRISSRGFTQPTPTTILSEADIAKTAEPNLFNTISQLPSLQGSTGRT